MRSRERPDTLNPKNSKHADDGPPADASFHHPMGLCCLSDGTVLISDCKNHCVRVMAYASLAHAHPRQTWRPYDPSDPPSQAPLRLHARGKGNGAVEAVEAEVEEGAGIPEFLLSHTG